MVAKKIIKKEPTKEKLTFLDLGCGQNKSTVEQLFMQGVITNQQKDNAIVVGIDMYKCEGVDKVFDMTKAPYPFKDNSIDGAFSNHFLEHLTGKERIVFFNEMWRILKKGARMRHIHPCYTSVRAIQDPTHAWPPIAPESYAYWQKDWRDANKLGHYLGNCDFDVVVYNSGLHDPIWSTKVKEQQDFATIHYFNVIQDLVADMTCKK